MDTSIVPSSPMVDSAEQIFRLGPQINEWAMARVLKQHLDRGVTLRQLTVPFLIREESATLSELARRLMITPAAVTGIVDRLEKRGYVRRLPGPADLRTVLLELTDAGRAASLAVHESLVADIAAELSTLTPDQVEELRRGLEVLDGVIQRLERGVFSVGE